MTQTRSLRARAEAVVAQARRLARENHALLAAVRASLHEAGEPPAPARRPERI
ncbi:MAG: hypothetical protein K2X71_04500 [Methylobacterium sp.]|uniref:hypothetical protein n=1 Tax=Methylobacterium sp. TaxID=409 RepID=UPI00258293FD|nr:hypothetical protein [Methylobacterium sp.]MBY0295290.1 hypothetical protein [Methylobacterium sp.]